MGSAKGNSTVGKVGGVEAYLEKGQSQFSRVDMLIIGGIKVTRPAVCGYTGGPGSESGTRGKNSFSDLRWIIGVCEIDTFQAVFL